MAEWSIAAVLKTVDLKGSGGSNPSLSAKKSPKFGLFFWQLGLGNGLYGMKSLLVFGDFLEFSSCPVRICAMGNVLEP